MYKNEINCFTFLYLNFVPFSISQSLQYLMMFWRMLSGEELSGHWLPAWDHDTSGSELSQPSFPPPGPLQKPQLQSNHRKLTRGPEVSRERDTLTLQSVSARCHSAPGCVRRVRSHEISSSSDRMNIGDDYSQIHLIRFNRNMHLALCLQINLKYPRQSMNKTPKGGTFEQSVCSLRLNIPKIWFELYFLM